MTKEDSTLVSHMHVTLPWVSDCCIVHFKLTIHKPTFHQKIITFQKWKSVIIERFKHNILDAGLLMLDSVSNITQYNTKLTELADRHAPVKSKTTTECLGAELEQEKRLKRKLERFYRCTDSYEDAQGVDLQCTLYTNMLLHTLQMFYIKKIESHTGGQKALFKVFDTFVHQTNEQQLPAHDDLSELTNHSGDIFCDKIEKFHRNILSKKDVKSTSYPEETSCCTCVMSKFQTVSEEEVEKVLSPTKYFTLDQSLLSYLKTVSFPCCQ